MTRLPGNLFNRRERPEKMGKEQEYSRPNQIHRHMVEAAKERELQIERQEKSGWCFLACAKAVLKFYGEERTQEELKEIFKTTEEHGTYVQNAVEGFRDLGYPVIYRIMGSILDIEKPLHCNLPVIVAWWHDLDGKPEGHYSLVENIRKLGWNMTIDLLDPEIGEIRSFEWEDFGKRWWSMENGNIIEQPMMIICPKEK